MSEPVSPHEKRAEINDAEKDRPRRMSGPIRTLFLPVQVSRSRPRPWNRSRPPPERDVARNRPLHSDKISPCVRTVLCPRYGRGNASPLLSALVRPTRRRLPLG